jgi:hypothetical protein
MQMQSLLFLVLLISATIKGQCPDSISNTAVRSLSVLSMQQPEQPKFSGLLSGGLIDFCQSGQMNAAARIYQVAIGEKDKLEIPLTLYSGISGAGLSGINSPGEVVNNFINPAFGIANLYVGELIVNQEELQRITGLKFHYFAAGRLLSAATVIPFENYNLFNVLGGMGFTIFTGAHERESPRNGVLWLNSRLLASINSKKALSKIDLEELSSILLAWSTGFGLHIPGAINGRVTYYKYINQTRSALLQKPLIQLSFSYGLQ